MHCVEVSGYLRLRPRYYLMNSPRYTLGNNCGRPERDTVGLNAVIVVSLRHSVPNISVSKVKFVSYLSEYSLRVFCKGQ
jgi:hypothetical protein